MRGVTARWAALSLLVSAGAVAQDPDDARRPCPRMRLPAYSHNDYQRARPLADAVEMGLRGVEADVFLVDGEVRVGHDRREAARAGTLDALYLAPLAALAARCGRFHDGEDAPFLLLVEIKESSQPTYDAVVALLARYDRWIAREVTDSARPIELMMVGWLPPARPHDARTMLRHQRIRSVLDTLVGSANPDVRLLSLDYGKTMGRRWRSAASGRRWLETLRAARRNAPDHRLRVHNVPIDARAYGELLGAGVGLIGTKDPLASVALLSRMGYSTR